MPDLIGVILRASASACQFCCWVYALQSEPKALLQGLILARDDDGFYFLSSALVGWYIYITLLTWCPNLIDLCWEAAEFS